MADQVMKASTELSALVPELWSANFYPTLLERLAFIESVDMSYQGEIAALGDTVNISSFPEFGTATDMAEDAANDAVGITVANTQLVINHQVVQDFICTRKSLFQWINAVEKLNELAMFSVMKKINDIIVTDTVPSSSSPDHTLSYVTTTTLAMADIIAAKKLLDAQDVSAQGRVAIVGSVQANDLFNVANFSSKDYIPGASPSSEGAMNFPIMGFNVKMATGVGNTSYWLSPSYLTVAIQEQPSVEVFNLGGEGKRSQRVNITSLMGSKLLDSTRVVSIS